MLTTHMSMNSLVNAHAALGMQVRAGDTGEWREVRGDRTTGSIVQLTTVYHPTGDTEHGATCTHSGGCLELNYWSCCGCTDYAATSLRSMLPGKRAVKLQHFGS